MKKNHKRTVGFLKQCTLKKLHLNWLVRDITNVSQRNKSYFINKNSNKIHFLYIFEEIFFFFLD